MHVIGTKAQVFHGTAEKTSGGLRKSDLMKNKRGRIVSKKKHALGLKAFSKLKKSPTQWNKIKEQQKKMKTCKGKLPKKRKSC